MPPRTRSLALASFSPTQFIRLDTFRLEEHKCSPKLRSAHSMHCTMHSVRNAHSMLSVPTQRSAARTSSSEHSSVT